MRTLNFFLLFIILLMSCHHKTESKLKLISIKTISGYSSSSGVESSNGRIYIMGDDAPTLLILDDSLTVIDSIRLVNYDGPRIPKDQKPDLESASFVRVNDSLRLLLIGSGSL